MLPLTWSELENLIDYANGDRINGNTNSQANLRLFGQPETSVRVTLYRDHHAWCPYCQKVWLWLEEKQIPYRIQKVTMFCYGEKENWYKRLVPSGMLPAIALDGKIITESDEILRALERGFGALTATMAEIAELRYLERTLLRAWCNWLCYPGGDQRHRQEFLEVVAMVEQALSQTAGAYFLAEFSTADIIFTPYLERMHASLFYYKGYGLRQANPNLSKWFDAMETRSTYCGTQSDFHTHAHDLPPQMGGCYSNQQPQALANQQQVNQGNWFDLPDAKYAAPPHAAKEAISRVFKHRHGIIQVNPAPVEVIDPALRAALTYLLTGTVCPPPPAADLALRYLRDRINVPRDMSIYAAKHLRTALEFTASLAGDRPTPPLPTRHRRDQDPANFR